MNNCKHKTGTFVKKYNEIIMRCRWCGARMTMILDRHAWKLQMKEKAKRRKVKKVSAFKAGKFAAVKPPFTLKWAGIDDVEQHDNNQM
jgi:hypothetical protein